MAGMKISVDAAMRARDVSRPQDEAADAPSGGQGAASQTAASQTGASQTGASQTGAPPASTDKASRPLPAPQFRPKKRSRRRGR
jgi:hypothetical protein